MSKVHIIPLNYLMLMEVYFVMEEFSRHCGLPSISALLLVAVRFRHRINKWRGIGNEVLMHRFF